jgi:hypothetical protein
LITDGSDIDPLADNLIRVTSDEDRLGLQIDQVARRMIRAAPDSNQMAANSASTGCRSSQVTLHFGHVDTVLDQDASPVSEVVRHLNQVAPDLIQDARKRSHVAFR